MALHPAFAQIDTTQPGALFHQMGSTSWQTHHAEELQTFESFRESTTLMTPERKTINVVPFGDWPLDSEQYTQDLSGYITTFFPGTEVVMLPKVKPFNIARITSRQFQGSTQLCSKDILLYLRDTKPPGSLCYLAVTHLDLFPDDEWNFVFGQGGSWTSPSHPFLFEPPTQGRRTADTLSSRRSPHRRR